MPKFYLDPGHGGSDPGAVGNGLREKDVTLKIALQIREYLNEYENVSVRMSRTTDSTVSLDARTNYANTWGADYLMSIHINSGGGTGYEDYIYNGPTRSNTKHYQDIIHAEIIKEINMRNRGQKEANFHMVRESNMPAILTENGFIDNSNDAAKMKQTSWINSVARGHVNGLVRAFNLQRKEEVVDVPTQSVKIQTGGLNNENLLKVVDYFRERNWYGQITMNWKDGNPKVTSGGLKPAAREEFENWLNEQGYWYRVL